MSVSVIFAVGAVLFIATTWATVAFGLSRVVALEAEQSVDRNEVDSLPRISDT